MSSDPYSDLEQPFAIAGIGASAGGLEAFTQLLQSLPIDTGMGFVLIQHLAADHDSQLSEILRTTTQMPVNEAIEGTKIVPNNVYVIPPNTSMTLEQGILKLEPRQRGNMVIDGFFSSLAADRGHQAIAVVLSGNNEDGTAGLGTIKSRGGITFAQDLASAEFPTMPMIAIASGYVDFVLSTTDIAAELVNISHKRNLYNADDEKSISESDGNQNQSNNPNNNDPYAPTAGIFADSGETLESIFTLLHDAKGVDFRNYKQGTIRRRISRRMGLLSLQKLEVYAQYLQEHPLEVEKLYEDVLINVTSFFREPESFNALQKLVFPAICKDKAANSSIRIWVAGCATGEEVYSIAISLLEFFDDRPAKYPIQIFATDISEIAINKARLAVYPHNLLIDVSPERLRRFFVPVEGGYQIGKSVRELCVFARQNLTSDPPFSRLDLISCRNMLIYLEPVLQKKVMQIFHYSLNQNCFLLLGSSEGVGKATDLFEIVDRKYRIYKRNPTPLSMSFNFVKSTYVKESVNLTNSSEPIGDINLELLADQVVLSQYAPVGVIINSELEILQFRGQTSLYLEPSPGKASLNLLKMVRSELIFDLRSLINDVQQQNIAIAKDNIEMPPGLLVKLNVVPLKSNSVHFLVLFESRPNPTLAALIDTNSSSQSRPDQSPKPSSNPSSTIEVARLTHELAKTKEYLRSIIETQEATNQDLKVALEEFLSSNEELQSTNEELETAKEEIQATNEELSTINDQMRSQNVELHIVNNDLQNLLRSVNIPILMLSGDLRIRRFTPMAEQSFNLIATDVGRPFSNIQTNIDVQHIRTLVASVIDTLIPYEQDVQDNSGNWYSLRIRPYRTTDNKIDGVVISLIDIDLLKRNKQELVTKNQALSEAMTACEKANQAKSNFLRNMSHELRTPLNAIMGFSQLLQSSPKIDAESQQFLGMIRQASEYLLSLIQDLLDISRIEAEKMELQPNLLSLSNFLQVTIEIVNINVAQKNLTLTTEFAADLPENIYADEKRLRQILLNLLSNAIKFTFTGAIALSVDLSQSTDQAGNQLIRFTVSDTGIGIATAEFEKIFTPFEQVGDVDTKPQGTGLGLAISQSLVQMMGGELKVSSQIGVGSTFSFELDLKEPQPQNAPNAIGDS